MTAAILHILTEEEKKVQKQVRVKKIRKRYRDGMPKSIIYRNKIGMI